MYCSKPNLVANSTNICKLAAVTFSSQFRNFNNRAQLHICKTNLAQHYFGKAPKSELMQPDHYPSLTVLWRKVQLCETNKTQTESADMLFLQFTAEIQNGNQRNASLKKCKTIFTEGNKDCF